MVTVPPTAELLGGLPLFSQVSGDVLETLAAAAQPVGLRRGEVLFRQGDTCTGFYVMVRGQVTLTVSAAEGQVKVLEIIGPGESFAEGVLFADRPFPVTATALSAGALLLLPRQAVLDLVDEHPTFARRMLAGMSIRLHTMLADVSAMALRTGTQRVVGLLLGEVGPAGAAARAERSTQVRLPAGKAVVASRLSLTPETFSRVLRLLADQGLVTVRGRTVELHDLAALDALLSG